MAELPIQEEIARSLGVSEEAIRVARQDPRGLPASLLEQGAIDTAKFEELVALVRERVAQTLKVSEIVALTCRGCGSRWKVRGAHPSRRYRCRSCQGLLVVDLSPESLVSGEEIRQEGEARELPPEVLRAMEKPTSVYGKYVLLSEAGRGGMGRVWRAFDTDLGRVVALKMMLIQSEEDLARFRQEAKLAARLDHPGIVQVYELGEEEGRPFIAMQFVEGSSLEGTRLPHPKAVAAIRDAARAIHYAHEQGVIHRDLKPGNLLQSRDGRVRVSDFGLAKRADVKSLSGTVVGTPAYMSPEQARGETSQVDARSDIYSLGATLYGLLVGAPPFQGTDIPAVLQSVAYDDPVPLRRINPGIARDLETLVLKAMEKEPRRRYSCAGEFADDLDRFLAGEPILGQRPSVAYRLRKGIARRKTLVVALLGLAAAGSVAAMLLPRVMEEREARLRVQKEKEAGEERARRLRELQTLWGRVLLAKQGFHQGGANPDRVRDRIRETLTEIDRFIDGNPALPQGLYVRARALLYLGDSTGAERALRRAVDLEPEFLPGYALLGQVVLERQQWTIYGLRFSSPERALAQGALVEEARSLLAKARAGGSERASIERWGLDKTREDEIAQVLADALHLQYVQKDTPRALKLLEEADRAEAAAEFCNWLGLISREPGECLRWQTRAITLMPHWAKPYFDRSEDAIRKGDYDKGIADLDRALQLDPRLAYAYGNRGAAFYFQNRFDLALADFTKAIELNPDIPSFYVNRASILAKKDRKAALEDVERAIQVDPRHAAAYTSRGDLRSLQDDWAGAIVDYDRALGLAPDDAFTLHHRGLARTRVGDFDGALADQTRAVNLNPRDAEILLGRAEARYMKEDRRGALEDAEAALLLAPQLVKARSLRGIFRYELGDLDGALADFDWTLEREPQRTSTLVSRGAARLLKGDFKGALADLDRGIELGYAPGEVLLFRARANEGLGRFPQALSDAERALKADLDPVRRTQAESIMERARGR